MARTLTLQMVFENEEKGKATISVPNVREDITASEVRAAMDKVVSTNMFMTSGGDIKKVLSADLVDRNVDQIV